MGEPIPDEEPDRGPCPDCCDNLPNSMSGKIVMPPQTFTGTIFRDEINPCLFSGVLWDGELNRPLIAQFCDDIAGGLVLRTLDPPIGCTILDHHCGTPASCTFMEDVHFSVG